MITHSQHLIQSLATIDWFDSIGQPVVDNVVAVQSWDDAIKQRTSHVFQVLSNATRNAISVAVARTNRELYNATWNEYVDAIKAAMEVSILQEVERRITDRFIPRRVLDAVAWDVLMACMESEYADAIRASRSLTYVDHLRPGFYTKLLKWYREGHFPCGWTGGEYPIGKLVVY